MARVWVSLCAAIVMVVALAVPAHGAETAPTALTRQPRDFVTLANGASTDCSNDIGLGCAVDISIDASSDQLGGDPSGSVSIVFELVVSGSTTRVTFAGPVTCLAVTGNRAVIGYNSSLVGSMKVVVVDSGNHFTPDEFGVTVGSTDCADESGVTLARLSGDVAVSEAAVSDTGLITTRYTDSSIDVPDGITTGPDGALWFTDFGTDSIGRISTDGTVTNFTDPAIGFPDEITSGPDGALWFTHFATGSIGRITTAGTVTDYRDPKILDPRDITAGPDGAVWFSNAFTTAGTQSSIGRITTDGVVTTFTDPTIRDPEHITIGADGALWFNDAGTDSIGRITTDGGVTSVPILGGWHPQDIAAGPDGALWFTLVGPGTALQNRAIGRLTTSGVMTTYPMLGSFYGGAAHIAAGPDGALWFDGLAESESKIGRISTTGVIRYFSDPAFAEPSNIVTGPDGALWFTDELGISIVRATVPSFVVPFGGVVTEGAGGTTSQLDITVTLSRPSTQTVTAQWNTVFVNGASNVQALPSTDYTPASGTVTFPPGDTTETVSITVLNHDLGMPFKLVVVSFHDVTSATLGGYLGLGFGFLLNNSS